jgi:hypothetical protein
MGIASLIIGIISLIMSLIPGIGMFFLFPAMVGLILGIVSTILKAKKLESKGISISGVVLNALAIIFIVIWSFLLTAATVATVDAMDESLSTEIISSVE